ncbi:hypothetical protein cand_033810 [Cryptosporidium andersoni]|uniref:Uncharacterized protein n=1 Tax=Cryptosporidium andersoni TaxID=117008 RepID=A0A1J4MXS2_9CRYT|nr:hypothetical protein cand_033810 [Cryptosporidium andersoni]
MISNKTVIFLFYIIFILSDIGVVYSSLFRFTNFPRKRIESQQLKIDAELQSISSTDGSIANYNFLNSNNISVVEAILFPSYAVLKNTVNGYYCSGVYPKDHINFSIQNKLTFNVNYWEDGYTSQYLIIATPNGIICMLPYTSEIDFVSVETETNSKFSLYIGPYQPNTEQIITQTSLNNYVSSCKLSLYLECYSNNITLSIPDSLYKTGLQISLSNSVYIYSNNGILFNYIFYDTKLSLELFNVMITADSIGIEYCKQQTWGNLGNNTGLKNMYFIFKLNFIFQNKNLYVVSDTGVTILYIHLKSDFIGIGKVYLPSNSALFNVKPFSATPISIFNKASIYGFSRPNFITDSQTIIGFNENFPFENNLHINIKLNMQEYYVNESFTICILKFYYISNSSDSFINIDLTDRLVIPSIQIIVFKDYVAVEDSFTRNVHTAIVPEITISNLNIQLQGISSKNIVQVLYEMDNQWFLICELSLEYYFSRISLIANYTEKSPISVKYLGSDNENSIITKYSKSIPKYSEVNGDTCNLYPMSSCSSLNVNLTIPATSTNELDFKFKEFTPIQNITIALNNLENISRFERCQWDLISKGKVVYELSLLQTAVLLTDSIIGHSSSGPLINFISLYTTKFIFSLIWYNNIIYAIDTSSGLVYANITEIKEYPVDSIKSICYKDVISITYSSSAVFSPDKKYTYSSYVLSQYQECNFFNQCNSGAYICPGSNVGQLCSDFKYLAIIYNGTLPSINNQTELGILPDTRSMFIVGSITEIYYIINVFDTYLALYDVVNGYSCYNTAPLGIELSSSILSLGIFIIQSSQVQLLLSVENFTSILCSIPLNKNLTDLYYFKSISNEFNTNIGNITMIPNKKNIISNYSISASPNNTTIPKLNAFIPVKAFSVTLPTALSIYTAIRFNLTIKPSEYSEISISISFGNSKNIEIAGLHILAANTSSILLYSSNQRIGTISGYGQIDSSNSKCFADFLKQNIFEFLIGIANHKSDELEIPYLYMVSCNNIVTKILLGNLNIENISVSSSGISNILINFVNGFVPPPTSYEQGNLTNSLASYKNGCSLNISNVISYCLTRSVTFNSNSSNKAYLPLNYEVTSYFMISNNIKIVYNNNTFFWGIRLETNNSMTIFMILFNETNLGVVNLLTKEEIWNFYPNNIFVYPLNWIAVSINKISGFIRFSLDSQTFGSFPDYSAQSHTIVKITILGNNSWGIFQGQQQSHILNLITYPFLYHGYTECSFNSLCSLDNTLNCIGVSFSGLCPYPPPNQLIYTFRIKSNTLSFINSGEYGYRFKLPNLIYAFNINNGVSNIFSFYFFKTYASLQYLNDGSSCHNLYGSNHQLITTSSLNKYFEWSFSVGLDTITLYTKFDNSKISEICSLNIASISNLRFNILYPVGLNSGIINGTLVNLGSISISPKQLINQVSGNMCNLYMFNICPIEKDTQVGISPDGTILENNFVFIFNITYNSEDIYMIDLLGIKNSMDSQFSIAKLEINGLNLTLTGGQNNIIFLNYNIEDPIDFKSTLLVYIYVDSSYKNLIVASLLANNETNNLGLNQRIQKRDISYPGTMVGISVPLIGNITHISSRSLNISPPQVLLSNWITSNQIIKSSYMHTICDLSVNPNNWCIGINATISDTKLDNSIVWLNFTFSDQSSSSQNQTVFSTTYELWSDNDVLLSLKFNKTKIILRNLKTSEVFTSFYTNETLLFPGDTIIIGISIYNETNELVHIINENKQVLVSAKISNQITNSIQNITRVGNSKNKLFTSYMLQYNVTNMTSYLIDGYYTCSLDSTCSIQSTSCSGQALLNPCPIPFEGIYWSIESVIMNSGMNNSTENILSLYLQYPELLSIYAMNNGNSDTIVFYFFKDRMAMQDLENNLVCEGPYINNQNITNGTKIVWTIGIDSNDMIYLGISDIGDSKNYTVCSFGFSKKIGSFVKLYPHSSYLSYSTFTQNGAGFNSGGYTPTSNLTTGSYNPTYNEVTKRYMTKNPYGINAPYLPVGIPYIPINSSDIPPEYIYNKTSSQYQLHFNLTNNNFNSRNTRNISSKYPNNRFFPKTILYGKNQCNLQLFRLCNSTSVIVEVPSSILKKNWTIFTMISTGIPSQPQRYSNYQYLFKNSLGQVVFKLAINDTTVGLFDENGTIKTTVAPQCGPYCSTYPGGFFSFWLDYDSVSNLYFISINYNKEYLLNFEATEQNSFVQIDGCCSQDTFNIWQFVNQVTIPNVVATTTTATPWYKDIKDNCILMSNSTTPCCGYNLTIEPYFNQGDILWINFTIPNSSSSIVADNYYLHSGFTFLRYKNKIFDLHFNQTSLYLNLNANNEVYTSFWTNGSLIFKNMNKRLGIAWNTEGLYILNSKYQSLINIPLLLNSNNYSFSYVYPLSEHQHLLSNYSISNNFYSPDEILFQGYSTCSFESLCKPNELQCSAQAVLNLCPYIQDGMFWKIDTFVYDTFINNGTWRSMFELPDLYMAYTVSNSVRDSLVIYIFNNRLALQDLINNISCSGPYPNGQTLINGTKIIWTLGIDSNNLLYLGVFRQDKDTQMTVCAIPYKTSEMGPFSVISPKGFAPSVSKFVQYRRGFKNGGFQPTTETGNGWYSPQYNSSSRSYDTKSVYNTSRSFFPVGIHEILEDGNVVDAIKGYHYNRTTNQFNKNKNNTRTEINPSQPPKVMNGINECNLYMFESCNGTSVILQPNGISFKPGWGLFIMISTGIPSSISDTLQFNYEYIFLDEGNNKVLSLILKDDEVIFSNLINGQYKIAGSPQCGPYCSTYPNGYFTFWVILDEISNNYYITVDGNQQYLLHLDATGVSFNKIVPCCGNSVNNSFNIWQLTNNINIPSILVTTTTTITTTATTITTTTTTTQEVSNRSEPDGGCLLQQNSVCVGKYGYFVNSNPSASWKKGIAVTLSFKLKDEYTDRQLISNKNIDSFISLEVILASIYLEDNDTNVASILLTPTNIKLVIDDYSYISQYSNGTIYDIGDIMTITLVNSDSILYILDYSGFALIQYPDFNNMPEVLIKKVTFNKIYSSVTSVNFSVNNYTGFPYVLLDGYLYGSITPYCDIPESSVVSQSVKGLCQYPKSKMLWTINTTIVDSNFSISNYGMIYSGKDLLGAFALNNGLYDTIAFLFYESRVNMVNLINNQTCSSFYPYNEIISINSTIIWSIGFDKDSIFLNMNDPNTGTDPFSLCSLIYDSNLSPFVYFLPKGYKPNPNMLFIQQSDAYSPLKYIQTHKSDPIYNQGALSAQILINNFNYYFEQQISFGSFSQFQKVFLAAIKISLKGGTYSDVQIQSIIPSNIKITDIENPSKFKTSTADMLVTFNIYPAIYYSLRELAIDLTSQVIFNPTSIFNNIFYWIIFNTLSLEFSPELDKILQISPCTSTNTKQNSLQNIIEQYGIYLNVDVPNSATIGFISLNYPIPNNIYSLEYQSFVRLFVNSLADSLMIPTSKVGVIAVADTPPKYDIEGFGVIKFFFVSIPTSPTPKIANKLALTLSNPLSDFSRAFNWTQIELGECSLKVSTYLHQ